MTAVVVGDDPFVEMVLASEGYHHEMDLREVHGAQGALPFELLSP